MQLAILKDAPLLDSIMTAKYLLDLHCGRGAGCGLEKCSVVDFDYDIEVAVGSLQWKG